MLFADYTVSYEIWRGSYFKDFIPEPKVGVSPTILVMYLSNIPINDPHFNLASKFVDDVAI